jgi:GTP-binding protein EngB required for normal cell division
VNRTLDAFKAQQQKDLELLTKLREFLQQGESLGMAIDPALQEKLRIAVESVAGDRLKIALVGGFSEGKTSIAAAWLEQLDKRTMKISHMESSNEVKIYEVGSDLVLIDTPGLFGFKEQYNAELHAVEKYKDITKKYVSEAHLVLYVMNSTNPLKESHQDDLVWLFRTLNLLPRTVFVLSRFDEVADVEDEAEYASHLVIKRASVADRLRDLIELQPREAADLSIVAVAANPFDMGVDHWLTNLPKFKSLSHIATLQEATSHKIAKVGGAAALVEESRQSVIRDVLTKQLPKAVATGEVIAQEVEKLEAMSSHVGEQLVATERKVADVRQALRSFVTDYFSDLILQAKGTDLETFGTFFEREVGSDGSVVSSRLQSEFDRRCKSIALEVDKMQLGFDAEVNHFNSMVQKMGKQGVEYLVSSKMINNKTILVARDGLVAAGKAVGLDLGKLLKLKPYGAVNAAKNLNAAIAIVGVGIEIWQSWEQAKREAAFRKAIEELVKNFELQRADLLALINGANFSEEFFPDFVALRSSVQELRESVRDKRQIQRRFLEWREAGDAIDVAFRSSING